MAASTTDDAHDNADPKGLWGDLITLWVSDSEDNKLYAYSLMDDPDTTTVETFGSYISDKNIPLAVDNTEARGIWSMPGILWVANDGATGTYNDTLYAYTMDTSSRTDVEVTIDSQTTVTLTLTNPSHGHAVVGSTGQVTVEANPVDIRASSEIINTDAAPLTDGHQALHPTGTPPTLVEILVTAQDESTTDTYYVEIHRLPSIPELSDPAKANGTIHLNWVPPTDPGTTPVTHYEIRYIESTAQTEVDDNWTMDPNNPILPGDPITTHSITGLLNGTQYTVELRAQTDLGETDWSQQVTITPSGKPYFDPSQPTAFQIPENSPTYTYVGDPISATDPDSDAILYALSGTGNENFIIDQTGQIYVDHHATLDYETTISYTLNIEITDNQRELPGDPVPHEIDDSIQITIELTNVQEQGSLDLSPPYPQVAYPLTATLQDPDGSVRNTTWEWLIYNDTTLDWDTLSGATSSSYTPQATQVDQHLAAVATYDDAVGTEQTASATTTYPVLPPDAPLTFSQELYEFPLMEDLPTSYAVGSVQAGPGTPTYTITSQPAGNHFTIDSDGAINTDKRWDYETASDLEPHILDILATRADNSEDTTQVSITLQNRLEPDDQLTLPNTIPGVTWKLIENTHFVMATDSEGRQPQYELNIQVKCINNYYRGKNRYADDLYIWQQGTNISYPTVIPTETKPFPGSENPLLRPSLWQSHDLQTPTTLQTRPRPGSNCQPDYTDIWNNADTLYAMDANARLIKAHTLEANGSVIARDHIRDIPLTDDHFRTHWKIQGIWADAHHVWVTAAEKTLNADHRSAAYSRSSFLRDETSDYTGMPALTLSPDHDPNADPKTYRPADKWNDGSTNLWSLHTQSRNSIGAADPSVQDPTVFQTCTKADSTTAELQVPWTSDQVTTPLRTTGNAITNHVYVLNHNSQYLETIDTSGCPPATVPGEYNYRDIPNRPAHPVYPSLVQDPTGITTDDGTPFMYFAFQTGEILAISKLEPLLNPTTIRFPENISAHSPIGPRHDPRITNIPQSPYSWSYTGDDGDDFNHLVTGEGNEFLQFSSKPGTVYDYETKDTYTFTLIVTDKEGDSTESVVTLEVINRNEKIQGQVSIAGDFYVGRQITAEHSAVTDPDGLINTPTPTYQWLRNGRAIAGATARTYDVTLTDYNKLLSVKLKFTDDGDFPNVLRTVPKQVTYIPITATLSHSAITVDEGQSTTITADLSEIPHRTVQLHLGVSGDTEAVADSDYNVTPVTFTFGAMDTSKVITFDALEDDVDEDNETVRISLQQFPERVSAGDTFPTELTIVDNDTAAVVISHTTLTVQEGSSATYSIKLDSEPTQDVTIALTLPADPELELSHNSLTFTPTTWETYQDITITASQDDDAIHEPDRQVTHTTNSDDPKYNDLTDQIATITVEDNDTAQITFSKSSLTIEEGNHDTYTIVLETEPSTPVTITINDPSNTDITAHPPSVVFTSQDWSTPKTVTVNTIDDDDAPDDRDTITHTVTTDAVEYQTHLPALDHPPYPAVQAEDIPVLVTDPDEPEIITSTTYKTLDEGTSTTYNVKLDTQPTDDVTVTITGHTDTPITLSDDSLVFTTTDWATQQEITVTADDDRDAEVPPVITIRHTAGGGDYEGETKDVVISIIETDSAGVLIKTSDTDLTDPFSIDIEENASEEYTVVLTSQPLITVDINIIIPTNAELTSKQSFEITPETDPPTYETREIDKVTFTPENWETPQTITIEALDDEDAVDETDVEISHETDTTDNLYGPMTGLSILTIRVTDDEPEVNVGFSAAAYTTTEGQQAAAVIITLTEDPNRPVTITLTAAPTSGTTATSADYSLSSTTVNFAAGNTQQTIYVTATDDTIDDDGEKVTLTIVTPLPPRVILDSQNETVVSLIDDDHPVLDISFAPSTVNLEESNSEDITATLTAVPERTVNIPITPSHGPGVTDADYSGLPTTITFQATQLQSTFSLTAVDDADYEQDETLTIGFGQIPPEQRITPKNPTTSTVTLKDNDNSFLQNLTTNQGSINPTFNANTHAYSTSVSYPTHRITVNTATDDSRATVEFLDAQDATLADSDGDPKALSNTPLAIGPNIIKVKVTSPSGQATTTYTLTVNRANPTIQIQAHDQTLTEGQPASFTITRTQTAADNLDATVNIQETVDDSKVQEAQETDHTVTIGRNQATATLTIQTLADNVWELHSTLTATLQEKTHYDIDLANRDDSIQIKDDDLPDMELTWDASSNQQISEDAGSLPVTLTLLTDADQEPHSPFNLKVTHTEGTGNTGATEPQDYTLPSTTTLAVAPSDFTRSDIDENELSEDFRYSTTQNLQFGIVNDAIVENDETFHIDLEKEPTDPNHIRVAIDDQALQTRITIQDDDRIRVATLESLTVTGQSNVSIPLTPNFNKDTETYQAEPAYLHHQVTVDYTTTVTAATATIDPADEDTNSSGIQYNLTPGSQKTVTITVTAENGTTTKAYTLNLTRNKAVVSINAVHNERPEGQAVPFTITRSMAAADALVVNLRISETNNLLDAANEGSKTATIPAGQTAVTHTIPTLSDNDWDEHSTVTAAILPAAAYTIQSGNGTDSTDVKDDDFPASTATLTAAPNPVGEAEGPVTLTLKVTTNADQQPHADGGSITVHTTDAEAQAPDDYTSVNRSNPFNASDFTAANNRYERTYTIQIPINDDIIDDEDETFTVTMAKAALASPHLALTQPSTHTIQIIDNDKSRDATLETLVITENTLSGDVVSLNPAFDPDTQTYTATSTYDIITVTVEPTTTNEHAVFAYNPSTDSVPHDINDTDTLGHQVDLSVGSNTITVTATAEDTDYTKTYTVVLTRQTPVVTVTKTPPDDLTEGDTAAFTISRAPAAAEPLVVTTQVTAPSTMATSSQTGSRTVTINAGNTSAQLEVDTVNDSTWESHAQVTAALSANPSAYSEGIPDSASHTVKDNDFPLATAKVTAPQQVAESAGNVSATITVTTSGNTEPHRSTGPLSLATADGSATAGEDYQSATGQLDLQAADFESATLNSVTTWSATKDWEVTINNDTDGEEDEEETFHIDLSTTTGTQSALTVPATGERATITILDDDTSSLADLDSLEVTITVSSAQVTLSPSFTAANTGPYDGSVNYPVNSVTVLAVPESSRATVSYDGRTPSDPAEGADITLAPGVNSITVEVQPEEGTPKTYTIRINRTKPSVTITGTPSETTEGNPITFTVTRSAGAPDSIEVNVSLSESGGDTLAPALETTHTFTIPAGTSSTTKALQFRHHRRRLLGTTCHHHRGDPARQSLHPGNPRHRPDNRERRRHAIHLTERLPHPHDHR